MEKQLEFRGIARETMIEYILTIANIDASHIITNSDDSVTIKKNNWSASISKEEEFIMTPTLKFPRLFIVFEGEEDIITEVIRQLRTKTIRLGG